VTYQVQFSRQALKSFESIPRADLKKIQKKIDSLSSSPYPAGSIKLQGSNDVYRIRSGDYRILYTVSNDELIILVLKIGHRRDVYQ
jgi:mRNA interferase RelE/StbE